MKSIITQREVKLVRHAAKRFVRSLRLFAISQSAQVGQPIKMMKFQRKKEAEARQRLIASAIRYVIWGLITAISIGGFALRYFLLNFCEV